MKCQWCDNPFICKRKRLIGIKRHCSEKCRKAAEGKRWRQRKQAQRGGVKKRPGPKLNPIHNEANIRTIVQLKNQGLTAKGIAGILPFKVSPTLVKDILREQGYGR